MSHITYPEAIVVGLLQGVSELFPVSSLGHSVLLPALIGGRWAADLNVSTPESPYLAFIVGLHVATAVALLIYFWRDWVRILRGFGSSIRHRRIEATEERLAWMIVVATIPVGLTGLALEHTFRTVLGRPVPAAIFLTVNGLVLYGAEMLRRRSVRASAAVADAAGSTGAAGSAGSAPVAATEPDSRAGGWNGTARTSGTPPHLPEPTGTRPDALAAASPRPQPLAAASTLPGPSETTDTGETDPLDAADERIVAKGFWSTTLIGAAQIFALLPGISRSGVTMAAGLARGLSHEDAARFAFLLATPVILAAGVLKLPDLFGPMGSGIGGQVLAGSVASGVGAYLAVRFLTRWFHTRTLTPFAIYCVLAGVASLVWLGIR
ncbi:MAG TPA: undecaprenyl-diphosphate phosphatase [Micromonosporaceae bacterium]|nr:undecaprenyl-diphosphate phosphatase [Micromonosporaceae bacterium]